MGARCDDAGFGPFDHRRCGAQVWIPLGQGKRLIEGYLFAGNRLPSARTTHQR